MPAGRAQPDGAGCAAVLALGDDVGYPHHGGVAQLGQAGAQHIAHLQGIIVHVKLDGPGAQLAQQLLAAPVGQLFQIALAGAGLTVLRLHIPGIDVHFPPVGAGGVYIAHPDGGALVTFASPLHKGHVGVIGVGKAPPGIQQIAPLGAVAAVRVEGGAETLEEQLFLAALAVQHDAEPQITGLPDGLAVVEHRAAGGLLGKDGAKAVLGAQLKAGPWLCGAHKAAHGGFGVLVLDAHRRHPLGQQPRGRVATHDQIRVLVLVGAGADAHGDAGVLVAAHQPPAFPQKSQIFFGGSHLQREASLGVVRTVPVKGVPYFYITHAGKGVCVQNVYSHNGSGRMPASIG